MVSHVAIAYHISQLGLSTAEFNAAETFLNGIMPGTPDPALPGTWNMLQDDMEAAIQAVNPGLTLVRKSSADVEAAHQAHLAATAAAGAGTGAPAPPPPPGPSRFARAKTWVSGKGSSARTWTRNNKKKSGVALGFLMMIAAFVVVCVVWDYPWTWGAVTQTASHAAQPGGLDEDTRKELKEGNEALNSANVELLKAAAAVTATPVTK